MPAPIGFLRSLAGRRGPISVRQADPADLAALEEMVQDSLHAYRGYGGALQESLHNDIFLSAWQEDGPAGLIMAHRQGPQVAWIYSLAVADDASLSAVGQALLLHLEQHAREQGIALIAYMDEFDLSWLRRLLTKNSFRPSTRVVGYEAPAAAPPGYGQSAVQVRPARREDTAAIAALDQAAFGPLWAYSERALLNVMGSVAFFRVAELEGQLAGYILGTLHEDAQAHIVRLAVDPRWQGQGIGTRLLAEAFLSFRAQDAERVSLNTQEENYRSQHLYRRFDFRPTGQSVGVWVKEVGP